MTIAELNKRNASGGSQTRDPIVKAATEVLKQLKACVVAMV